MQRILLVGATGQLGACVFKKLALSPSYGIRILVREDSGYKHLNSPHLEVFFGDLTNKDSLTRALAGCDVVITTANAIAPRKKTDTFQKVDFFGYRDLIDAAKAQGVRHFIYTSAYFPVQWAAHNAFFAAKMATEDYLINSGLNYTIFRPDSFMDVHFAFMGTTLPLKNEVAATVNRPFPFMQNFYKGVKDNIAKGKIGIIGDGQARHGYITIDNVADFLVKSIGNSKVYRQTLEIGGPEALSPLEVKAIFEKLLGTPLQVKKTPAWLMRWMGVILRPFNPAAASLLNLNYLSASESTLINTADWSSQFGIRLTSAEEYLRSKIES